MDYTLENVKWGPSTTFGTSGGTVSWSLTGSVGALYRSEIQAAFDTWSSIANITFHYTSDASVAQIDLGFGAIDGVGNTLGVARYSYSGSLLAHADVTFDSAEPWSATGNGLALQGNTYFEAVALHEIGHAIGLGHYDQSTAIMNSVISPGLRAPTASDAHGIVAIYGSAAPIDTAKYNVVGAGDFAHDGTTDVLFQHSSDGLIVFTDASATHTLGTAPAGYKPVGTGDFNADGTTDVLFQNAASGYIAEWIVKNGHVVLEAGINTSIVGFDVKGVGDFNGDGTSDILFQNNSSGFVVEWLMQDGRLSIEAGVGTVPSGYAAVGRADINGDGIADVVLQNAANGNIAAWQMDSRGHIAVEGFVGTAPAGFRFAGAGDFNHDGTTDILLQNSSTNAVVDWTMSRGQIAIEAQIGTLTAGSRISTVADINNDHTADIVLQNATDASVHAWQMANGQVASNVSLDWILA